MRSIEVFPKLKPRLAGLWDDSLAEIERAEGLAKLRVTVG